MSVIVKINTRSREAKKLLAYLKTLSFVKVETQGLYNPEFIQKIRKAEKEKGGVEVTADNLWETIK